jgi:PAS domain S-box-containing protein
MNPQTGPREDIVGHGDPPPSEVDPARFLAEAGRVLGGSLDFHTTLGQVADLVVPRLADWCAVELLDEDGRLTELALVHDDDAAMEIVTELRRRYPPDPASDDGSYGVVRRGESLFVRDIDDDLIRSGASSEDQAKLLIALELRSYLCVPLRAGGRTVGTLTLATGGSGRRLGETELVVAEDLAARAGIAIDNARAFQAADRYRRIVDAVAEAVFITDPTTGIVRDANRRAADLLGRDRNAVVGRPIWELVDGLDEPAVRDLVTPLMDGRVESRTVTASLGDGSSPGTPVDVLLQPLDLPGETRTILAIARDVSERVEAHDRLQRLAAAERVRAAELNAVIGAMGDGVIVCAPDGVVTLSNPASRALLGGPVGTYDDLLGRLRGEDELVPEVGHRGGPVAMATRTAPQRWLEIATYPVDQRDTFSSHDTGGPPETIVILRDVTAHRQREAVRERFIDVLSHELQTPVTTIYGGAKVLARPGSSIDEQTRQAIFLDIVEDTERLQRLVDNVVALSRFGESVADIVREPVLLQRVVPAVVQVKQERWPDTTFSVHMPAGLPTVAADATYVEQVVRNLLSNAAKFGGDRTHAVDVVLEAGEGEVAVRVLDDGPGFDPDDADRLFELFYSSPVAAGKAPGAGIGLFVSARLVEAMDGRIWARPRPAGGAEFGFALPVMDGA